jgi:hypothetical protein
MFDSTKPPAPGVARGADSADHQSSHPAAAGEPVGQGPRQPQQPQNPQRSQAQQKPQQSQQPLDQLELQICELAGHLAAATCRFLQLLAEFDARSGWADWDMPSCAAWLSWKCGMASGTAREQVRVARALTSLPVIHGEFAAGRLSYSKTRALTRIATPDSDADLAEMAAPMTANQLERFARAHRKVTRADDEQALLARRLSWRFEDNGSMTITARLPPDDGMTVLTALRSALLELAVQDAVEAGQSAAGDSQVPADGISQAGGVSAETPPDRPTSSSLADALVTVAESFITAKAANASNPDLHHVIVHADAAALAGDPAGRCHIDDGPAISPDALQMIACDAVISWMTHDRDGNVLNVGRRHRVPPPALRRAMRERDRGRCRYPGCHSRRVEAHHIIPWSQDGITCLDNLCSLCRYHHRLIHRLGHYITIAPDGDFTFHRPDGEVIPASPPLPDPLGQLWERHDAEITASTITPPWYGERLDLDYAIAVLFANQRVREERAAAAQARDAAVMAA